MSHHDIFISYAHIDNEPGRGVSHGWVSNLHYDLERAVSRQLGWRCDVWFDQSQLRGHHAVTPEILDKLAQVETLIVVLSYAYEQSEWCRRELEHFLARVPNPAGRLFVVDTAGLPREETVALGFGDLTMYRFWYRDENKRIRTYGFPTPRPEEPEYYRLIEDLATDIADSLKVLRTPPGQPARRAGPASDRNGPLRHAPDAFILEGQDDKGQPIVLAEVTDDLEPARQQLRRYLDQAGHQLRLCDAYGVKADAFARELRSNLKPTTLLVQLLSQVPSRPLPELPEGYAILQHRIALECGARVLQWRDPSLDVGLTEDADHRQLLLKDTVHAVAFESFKRLVVDTARATPARATAITSAPFVFINAEKSDHGLALRIKEYVGQFAAAFLPVNQGKPEEIRRDLEENIVDCDGLLVVYGDGSAAWVHQQLRLYNKLAPQRQKPIKLLAVIEAPPDAKPDINVQIPGMRVLNCRAGLDEATLASVISGLAEGRRQ